MNRKELAETMLPMLYAGRMDEIGTLCESLLMCRDEMRSERRQQDVAVSMCTPEEMRAAEDGGVLAEEVVKLLKYADYRSIEMALKRYV